MKRLLTASSILALCTVSFAQAPFVTSPDGFLTTEGSTYAWVLGEYPEGRMMFFDGEMRGKVMAIKETAYRHDYRDFAIKGSSGEYGAGRSWTKVTLDISHCDYTKLSATFSLNPTTTPTRVFDSPVTWPHMTTWPTTLPSAWSIKFPFKSNFIHLGNKDICLDYDFNGGSLANAGRWSTCWYATYALDSFAGGDFSYGQYKHYGTGCMDSGNTIPGLTYVYTAVYSSTYTTNPPYQNKYRVYTQTRYTALGKPLVLAISVFGNLTGTPFPGVACEKIWLDLNQPMFFFNLKAAPTGNGQVQVDFPLIPYNKLFEGIAVWGQSGWDDSATGSFKLTMAERTYLPKYPFPYKRKMIVECDPVAKKTHSNQNPPIKYGTNWNPIIRYAQ